MTASDPVVVLRLPLQLCTFQSTRDLQLSKGNSDEEHFIFHSVRVHDILKC